MFFYVYRGLAGAGYYIYACDSVSVLGMGRVKPGLTHGFDLSGEVFFAEV
jgi:hypothetical protein